MARSEFTRAVLLRSIAYRDADRIVTLLTESHGKVALVARGARKSARRFAGALEPGAILEVELALGAGDLGRLDQARVLRAFPALLGDLGRLSACAAGLEIVREAVGEREPDARWLPEIERFFERLGEVEAQVAEDVLYAFALRALSLAGLAPNLDACGRCGRAAPPGKAAMFDPALGAIVCRACGGGPLTIRGPLRGWLAGATGRGWDALALATEDRPTVRRAIDELCARHLGRPIQGLDIVGQVREVAALSRGEKKKDG